MNEIKFSEYKIISILNEVSTETPVHEICKKYQISLDTFSRWERHYTPLKAPTPKKRYLKLEEINKHLKDLFKQVCSDQKRLQNVME